MSRHVHTHPHRAVARFRPAEPMLAVCFLASLCRPARAAAARAAAAAAQLAAAAQRAAAASHSYPNDVG